MARLATKRRTPEHDEHAEAHTRRNTARRMTPNQETRQLTESPSPAVSFSSDKENRTATAARDARDKTRSTSGATVRAGSDHSSRRRGLEDRSAQGQQERRQPARASEEMEESREDEAPAGNEDPHSILDTRFYDPEQRLTERRPLRKAIRDLTRELQESRHEYMAVHSNGIFKTLKAANEQFAHIKQTSDATLDSNLLVKAADLAARRSLQTRVNGSARGIDVSEFAAKCASFMRHGPAANQLDRFPRDVQNAVDRGSGRTRLGADEDSDAEGGPTQGNDDGDELNWAWLGLSSASPASVRPRVPGFLLGPLSVQKKVRVYTQRTARQAPQDPANAVRPAELDASAIEKVENANLTALCKKIFKTLRKHRTSMTSAAHELLKEDMDDEQIDAILDQHHLRDNGGVCLLNFAFNPESFGQTIENLFYISFLIRDGKAGLAQDSKGRLSLHPMGEGRASNEQTKKGGKTQAVLHLDFSTWRDICKEFGIQKCIIGHRAEDGEREVAAGSWYG